MILKSADLSNATPGWAFRHTAAGSALGVSSTRWGVLRFVQVARGLTGSIYRKLSFAGRRAAREGVRMETPSGSHALVRGVPRTFDRAIRPPGRHEPIDVARAREEHRSYCRALRDLGLSLIEIDADDRYPDCCFVEDTAVVLGDRAIIAAMAPSTRRGETDAVASRLREHRRLHYLEPPACLDGGDVVQIGSALFVGLSQRTNAQAIQQLSDALADTDLKVIPVEVRDVLHFKTACTYLGGNVILLLPGHLEEERLAAYEKIYVPAEEAHAANCVSINRRVLVPSAAPRTRARIQQLGLRTVEIDISECIKAGGRLSCSSIIW